MDLSQFTSQIAGVGELARRLGVPSPLVSQWRTRARQIPIERCAQIERATAGAVSVEELRPDVNWHRVRDPEWPHPHGRPLVDVTPRSDVRGEAAA